MLVVRVYFCLARLYLHFKFDDYLSIESLNLLNANIPFTYNIKYKDIKTLKRTCFFSLNYTFFMVKPFKRRLYNNSDTFVKTKNLEIFLSFPQAIVFFFTFK